MRDYLFFPLAIAAMLGMVALALKPGPERVRAALAAFGDPESGVRIEGETLSMLQMPDGLSMDMIALPDGTDAARLAAFRPYDQPPLSQGAFITLPPDFGRAFAGHRVRVTVSARRAPASGSPAFKMAYFGGEDGQNSGWRDMQTTDDVKTFYFDLDLPPDSPEPTVDYIAVWPDPEGMGRAIDLVSMSARIVGELPSLRRDAPEGPEGETLAGEG